METDKEIKELAEVLERNGKFKPIESPFIEVMANLVSVAFGIIIYLFGMWFITILNNNIIKYILIPLWSALFLFFMIGFKECFWEENKK